MSLEVEACAAGNPLGGVQQAPGNAHGLGRLAGRLSQAEAPILTEADQ